MRHARTAAALSALLLGLTGCADSGDDNDAEGPAGAPSVSASAPAPAPTEVAVRGGSHDPADPTIALLAYLPASIAVVEGATVTWTVAGPEPHSVTFFPAGQKPPTPDKASEFFAPAPATKPYDGSTLANSGLGPQGPGGPLTFKLTFAKAGTFTYVCVIHPQMTGTVAVGADAAAEPQAEIDARGKTEEGQWLAEGQAAKKKLLETGVQSAPGSNGRTAWTVQMGATTPHTDVLAFAPAMVPMKAGDTVTFVNGSGAPHTATFAGGTTVPPNPEDPKVLAPAPGGSPQTLKATGYYNTGWLPPDAPPGQGPPLPARSFTFQVPSAGSYNFICALHVPSGMAGQLAVA